MKKAYPFLALILCLLFINNNALVAQKKALTVKDYGRWSQIRGATISNDGEWMAYHLRPNEGNDTLYVKSLSTDKSFKIPLGENAEFSSDSRWVAYITTPDEETQKKMEKAKEKVYKTAWLINVKTGQKYSEDQAAAMSFSEDGKYWAVHRAKPKPKAHGQDLIVRNLADGIVKNIGNVSEYGFNKRSDMLAYVVDTEKKSGNGIYLHHLNRQTLVSLDTDTLIYSDLAWDDQNAQRENWNSKGRKLAVLKGPKIDSLVHRPNKLIVFEKLNEKPKQKILDPASSPNFPQNMVISENRKPSWSTDGNIVFLGIREQEPQVKMDQDTIANVDVFHWKDDRIQTVQQRQSKRDERFTWVASFLLKDSKFTRLTDEDMRELNFSRHNDFMIGRDEKPYINDVNWGVSPADLYRVNVQTGERKRFAQQIKRPMGFSPDGRYYLYQKVSKQDASLMVYDVHQDKQTNISAVAPVSFINKDYPYPHESPAYGLAGWTEDKKHVIVNHKYDLWMLALDGSDAKNITGGVGQDNQIIFHYKNLDEDQPYIDTKNMLLTGFGEWTKKDGFYRLRMGNKPRELRYDNVRFGSVQKAKDADRVILTRQTFVDFPDYHQTTTNFDKFEKITDANPQQAEYAWGRRILVDYENSRGNKLQGTLTLPAGYEEGEKYPMIVYFYEKMSDRHHQYSMPVFDDRPQMSTYASNGYLVFMPDVVYEVGKPGTSALDVITSATQKVIDLGYADPDRIGLQGHSWGGYQSSFILTQTDMFATVVTGAPPTNLTSFYNNIYGSTGTNHHGIMEIGQVRMGRNVTPWNSREVYNRENPMYYVPNIKVPFLILHGTDDGAVDWMQGLEFYNAARRLGKQTVLLSYPDEGHHLGKKANQKDFQIRMKQWFDHFVKDEKAPKWIQQGVPYIQKTYYKADQ